MFKGQLFNVIDLTLLFRDMIFNINKMKYMRMIDPKFRERIMLAVTVINQCIYCQNYHSKVALAEGIARDELDLMFNNDFKEVPEEQLRALIFSQTYARYKGKLDLDELELLQKHYVHYEGILATLRTIMIGNSYGIAYYCLVQRLKFKPIKGSNFLFNELGPLLSPLISVPLLLLFVPFSKLFRFSSIRIIKKHDAEIPALPLNH
ncbi:MAG: carboxymuconolactone decarboxylase family protein [Candidatus Heimdallarchaeota archaeon]|nr:carboxymuconolactone decarboxylase family protein [Candidatus Heimdallarchaeota archaeon]